jgi:hypothetical protein
MASRASSSPNLPRAECLTSSTVCDRYATALLKAALLAIYSLLVMLIFLIVLDGWLTGTYYDPFYTPDAGRPA